MGVHLMLEYNSTMAEKLESQSTAWTLEKQCDEQT